MNGTKRFANLLHVVLTFKKTKRLLYLTSMEEFDGTLCHGISFALINTCKYIGILVHVLEGVLILFLQGVELVVILVNLQLLGVVLSFQFSQFLVVFLFGLLLTNGNQVLLLLLELIRITEDKAKRVLAHTPLIHRLLVEHHHALLCNTNIAYA